MNPCYILLGVIAIIITPIARFYIVELYYSLKMRHMEKRSMQK